MQCLISPITPPVIFTIGGKFTSTTPWQHESLINDDDELFICINGELPLRINNVAITVHQNELLLVPKGTTICGNYKTDLVSFLWLHFLPSEPAILQDLPIQSLKNLSSEERQKSFYLPTFLKLNELDRTLVIAHQLLNNYWQDVYQFEERNYLMTYLLLTLSSEFFQSLEQQAEDPNEIRILHIKNWIRANMSSRLRVEQISNAFGLSEQYLSRLFKEHEGTTVIQYINSQKIRVAQVLLLETSLSIKEISAYAYFKNEKQFFLQFKKLTGTTPLKFRQVHGTIHTNNPHVDPDLPIPKEATLVLRKLRKSRDAHN